MKNVYICSPLRPVGPDSKKELKNNIEIAKQACRLAISKGYLPLAPHLYFTQFLDDDIPKERTHGQKLGIEWLKNVSELWVIGDRISSGMQQELNKAKEWEIPVKYIALQILWKGETE